MRGELLFEIGCEELPASYIGPALEALSRQAAQELRAARLDHAEIKTFGTPRRLALVLNVAERQAERVVERVGPPKSAAYDAQGKPTKAAAGFARSQGVAVGDLEIVATPKGDYVCARKREEGRPAREVLPDILVRLVTSIPFPKSMRWGASSSKITFARPIHWLLAVLGEVPLTLELEGIVSAPVTYGHRFVSPGPIEVRDSDQYLARLEEAKVIADYERRRGLCRERIVAAAREAGGSPLADEELLDEVTNLVEYPVAVCGRFDEEFLELPRQVLVTAMREHQRYFAVVDDQGELLPAFISVVNTPAEDLSPIRTGNERVLRARLADARFFFRDDTRRPLANRLEDLKKVIFQSGLGTSYEKAERLARLAGSLAGGLYPESAEAARRAALLCKCDLLSEMVGEFPSLQGVMGGIYARLSGEPEAVAQAIAEHYLPKGAHEEVPQSEAGVIASLADKLDNICGCFGLGLIPTGTADPYALRRQALAIITLCWVKGLRLDLREPVQEALGLLTPKLSADPAEVEAAIIDFFKGRLEGLLLAQGLEAGVIQAALAVFAGDVLETRERARALSRLKGEAVDFERLAVLFKRVANIVEGAEAAEEVQPDLFEKAEEGELYEALGRVAPEVEAALERKDFYAAALALASLKETVDRFFDGVMVMVDEAEVRANRLALLKRLHELALGVADISKIPG